MLSKNKEYIVDIVDIGQGGVGIGKYEGFTVFVDGGLVQDKIKVKITKSKKNYAVGDMIEIIDTGTVINDGVYGFTLVVDDIENVKKVQADLEKLKFNYSIKIEYDTTLLKNIVNITNAVIISIVIIMLLININFLKKNIIRYLQ